MVGYTQKTDPETSARAIGKERSVSPKHCAEVLRRIRGLPVGRAKARLQAVIDLRTPIPYRRHDMYLSPKRGTGPGRFPVKAAEAILETIESAERNAEYKGLDPETLVVRVAAAHRGRIQKGYTPRAHGRSTPWNEQTAHIEIILAERTTKEG